MKLVWISLLGTLYTPALAAASHDSATELPPSQIAVENSTEFVWPPEHPDWASWPRLPGTTVCTVGTSCTAHYSSNGMGCCPYEKAVCCPNGQTCCPADHICNDTGTYLTQCVPSGGGAGTPGLSVCKPGAAGAPSKTLPNVLIIGDSVSIGYTPMVAAHMSKVPALEHISISIFRLQFTSKLF